MRSAPLLVASIFLVVACDGSDTQDAGQGASAGTAGTASNGTTTGGDPGVPYAACGAHIFRADGSLDEAEYDKQARLWDRATIDCRLGPKASELPANGEPAAPTAWERPHEDNPEGYLCKRVELSGTCDGSCDYGSTAGQVLFAPDAATEPGLDRAQTYAYENGTICQSPQAGAWLGGPHPDPALDTWSTALSRPTLLPNGFHQTESNQTNGGILIFPDGLVGATGNQTSHTTYPFVALPPNKVPTAVAVTGYNEFALVTIWDTETHQGQIAVFALRADEPGSFSVPYFALPNEAGFKNIHLLGYVDLPETKTPTMIAALGNNGGTPGGHAIGNEFANPKIPAQNIATSEEARMAFARDDHERWVPTTGHAVVGSFWENELVFVDLEPLFAFVRDAYFTSKEKFDASATQDAWPYTFDSHPEMKPVVVTTLPVDRPRVARVGNMLDAFPEALEESLHAFVAGDDGKVHLYDISGFMGGAVRPVPADSIREIAVAQAGRNIVSMRKAGHANKSIVVASRGDRAIQFLAVDKDTFGVTRTIRDTRIEDPVVVDLSDRGPIVTVGDFTGQKIHNYRIGKTEENGGKPPAGFGCGPDGADAECEALEYGGALSFPGAVFYVGTTNVN